MYEVSNSSISREVWNRNWEYSDKDFWKERYRKKTVKNTENFEENGVAAANNDNILPSPEQLQGKIILKVTFDEFWMDLDIGGVSILMR